MADMMDILDLHVLFQAGLDFGMSTDGSSGESSTDYRSTSFSVTRMRKDSYLISFFSSLHQSSFSLLFFHILLFSFLLQSSFSPYRFIHHSSLRFLRLSNGLLYWSRSQPFPNPIRLAIPRPYVDWNFGLWFLCQIGWYRSSLFE